MLLTVNLPNTKPSTKTFARVSKHLVGMQSSSKPHLALWKPAARAAPASRAAAAPSQPPPSPLPPALRRPQQGAPPHPEAHAAPGPACRPPAISQHWSAQLSRCEHLIFGRADLPVGRRLAVLGRGDVWRVRLARRGGGAHAHP